MSLRISLPLAAQPANRLLSVRAKYKLLLTTHTRFDPKARMARRPQTNPRKTASQKRSRLTVDALLEATARILVKDGYDGASTNKIAATAGVSIGSLYQYFPSKEALVAGVIERHAQDLMQVARDTFLKAATQPIEVAARELVTAGINAHRVDPKLHRVLAEEVPHTGRGATIDSVQQSGGAFLRSYLEAHRDEIEVADLDLAAFMLVTTVEALTHSAVLRRPDLLSDEKVERFIDEATRLVVRYLRAPLLDDLPRRHQRVRRSERGRAATPPPPPSGASPSPPRRP
jgi:AcrR family transcriptional regulator